MDCSREDLNGMIKLGGEEVGWLREECEKRQLELWGMRIVWKPQYSAVEAS